jgi:hypothetical protein
MIFLSHNIDQGFILFNVTMTGLKRSPAIQLRCLIIWDLAVSNGITIGF